MDAIVKRAETDEERVAAFRLRESVFLVELGRARNEEVDEYDRNACHVIAVLDDNVVGALRAYVPAPDVGLKIGRVAVDRDHRRRGIGLRMMEFAHDWAIGQGFDGCHLHAQVDVRPFYEALGYAAEGAVFVESGTEHIRMVRRFERGHTE